MNLSKVLIVGGTFDENSGKPSGLINKLFAGIDGPLLFNGGNIDFIKEFLNNHIMDYEIILWFANISNDVEKFNDIKNRNPKVILVESKRNDNNKYSDKELIWHMLKNKANLMLEFSKHDEIFRMRLLDPLGNEWLNTTDSTIVADTVFNRALFLSKISRQKTVNVPETIEIPENNDFFEIIRKNAETFSDLINPAEEANKRFLGNASFRCENGFPSFRDVKNKDLIFVSKRNVNKETIGSDGFVPVTENSKGISVFSECKASVDTPVQVKLYRKYKHINYMLHAHVYINGAPITENNIPCGGLEEVDEIIDCIEKNFKNEDNYYINLKGHGSIILAKDLDAFKNVEYIKRPIPEVCDMSKKKFKKYVHIPFEELFEMERLHLRVSEDSIDILYRPNHNYIGFVPNDENGRAEVKRLAELSREEFAKHLSTVVGFPNFDKSMVPNIKQSKAEEWYNGAWKSQTVKLFNEIGIENPVEEPITVRK